MSWWKERVRHSLARRLLARPPVTVAVAIGLLAVAVRLPGLGAILTADEHQWVFRSQSFYRAIATGDIGGTFQGTHPGVVPMLLIGGGIRLQELLTGQALESPTIGPFRVAAKLPVALATAALVGLSAGLATRLWGAVPGIASGVLLALEPYLVGLSQLAHVDALLAFLMVPSLLSALLAGRTGAGRHLAVSSFLAGLALLTKLPALFLFAVIPCFLLFFGRTERPWSRRLRASVRWGAVALALSFLLWPSQWINLLPNLHYAQRDVASVSRSDEDPPEAFALGAVPAPVAGPAFYLRALLARTEPYALALGLLATLVAVRSGRGPLTRDLRLLLACAVGFGVLLALVDRRADRYLAPSIALVDLAGGVTVGALLARAPRAFHWLTLVTTALLAAQVVLASPYAVAYGSPLAWREELSQSGWGEGLEQIATALNVHPLAAQLQVASWYPAVFGEFFDGHTMSLSSRDDPRVDFVVLYRNMAGRAPDAASTDILHEFRGEKPAWVARVRGREVAWAYAKQSADRFPAHVGELVAPQALRPSDEASAVEVGQFITPEKNSLRGVRLLFATFSSRPRSGRLRVEVREVHGGRVLRSQEIGSRSVSDNVWYEVAFPPIPDSAGKTYYLAVTSPDGRAGDAVTLKFQPLDIAPGALVILRKSLPSDQSREPFRRPGDLAYQLLYEAA